MNPKLRNLNPKKNILFLTLFAIYYSFVSNAQIMHPSSGNTTLVAGSDFVDDDIYYDSGGSTNLYLLNQSSTLNFTANSNQYIIITFSAFDVEASNSGSQCYDSLTISGDINGLNGTYSGDNDDNGSGLSCIDATDTSGNATLGPFQSEFGGTLTFEFNSDASVVQSGWEAIITIVEDNQPLSISCPADFTIGNNPSTCEATIDFDIQGMFAVNADYAGNGADRGALMMLNTTTGTGTVQGTPMQGRSLLGLAQSNDGTVYATTDGREFITIEPRSGVLRSTITVHNSPIWDLAIHPDTDVLYGMQTINNTTNTLVTIDKTTGAITATGSPIPSEEATQLSIGFAPDGTLYGLQTDNFVNDGGNLLVIDHNTGTIINEIVLSTHLGASGLGVDNNGLIYISECCTSGNTFGNVIWTIDPSNGNTTQIGSVGGNRIVEDIAFMKLGAIASNTIGDFGIFYSPASNSTFPLGTTTVTATVTDSGGRSASCSFDVTVEDREAPTIACPANIVTNSDAGVCGAIVNLTEHPTVSDICSAPENITVTQTGGPTLGGVFPVGFSRVELTATDENGNSSSCTFIVEVVDVESPAFTSNDITVTSDSGSCDATVSFSVPQPTDNCPLPPTSVPGFSPLGSYNGSTYFISDATYRPYDAFDHANNNGYKMITINDINENFHIQNVVNAFFGTPTNVLIGGFKNQDNSITWQDFDTSTFTNWDDGQPFFFPHIEILGTNGRWKSVNTFVEFRHYIIEFDGGEVLQTSGPSSGSAFPIGDTLVEFSYTDGGGNTAVSSFNVTVIDNEAPVVSCPQDQSVTADQSTMTYQLPDYFALGEVSSTDNCTSIFTNFTQNPQPGTELPAGTHTISFTVADEYDNASNCSFELNVDDNTLGIENPNQLEHIKLYPNPAKDILTIYNPNSLELDKVHIYDIRGRQVKEASLYSLGTRETINLNDLAPSTYFVRINGKQGQIIKKIIKE